MTLEEFSDEFDVLLQAYNTNFQLGMTDPLSFSEYEKSVFLTQSQEEIVKELYNGKNPYNDFFEKTEEIKQASPVSLFRPLLTLPTICTSDEVSKASG